MDSTYHDDVKVTTTLKFQPKRSAKQSKKLQMVAWQHHCGMWCAVAEGLARVFAERAVTKPVRAWQAMALRAVKV